MRRLAAALAATAVAVGGVVLLGAGSASGDTIWITRYAGASQCFLDLPGLPRQEGSTGVAVDMEVPVTAVQGRTTAPIRWRVRGSLDFSLADSSPLKIAMVRAGATKIAVSTSATLIYYSPSGPAHYVSAKSEVPLSSGVMEASGSGELPGLTLPWAGKDVGALYSNGGGTSIIPLKADGTQTSLGPIGIGCLVSPWIPQWYSLDVFPAPTAVEHTGATRAGLAGTDVDLGTGTLALSEEYDKSVTGTLTTPQAGTAALRLLGVIPATARVRLTPGPVTGTFAGGFTAPATVTVSDFAILGFPLVRDKNTCQSATTLALTAGDGLAIDHGGTLSGTYDLPAFTGCGAYTGLISSLFSRTGNTLTLTTDAG